MLAVYDRVILPNPATRRDEYNDCYWFFYGEKSRTPRCGWILRANSQLLFQ
jgi:hypothetical protein